MACEDIEARLGELRAQKRQIEAVLPNLQGAGLAAAQANLANVTAQIAAEQERLADCRALSAPAAARAFTGRVTEIHCREPGAEVGKQEPYLLIASVDLLATLGGLPLPASKPAVHCVKVGPWTGIKDGTRASADQLAARDRPAFWDLDGNPRIVRSPQDVAFLVALVENDGASPDAIRGAASNAVQVSVVNNLNRQYAALVDTLASAMAGAVDSAAGLGIGPGHANFDDRIGGVQNLALTADDLQAINALGRLEKTLTFRNRKNSGKVTDDYAVTFAFEA